MQFDIFFTYIWILGKCYRAEFVATNFSAYDDGVQAEDENKAINPLRAKFFRGNIKIYLHFVSFLHIDMTHVVEILS